MQIEGFKYIVWITYYRILFNKNEDIAHFVIFNNEGWIKRKGCICMFYHGKKRFYQELTIHTLHDIK